MIRNHKLTEAIWRPSPNKGAKVREHLYLVAHYTAGRSAADSATWLCSPAAKASAHLVIGRHGELYQLVAFDDIAWHAGPSKWREHDGVNKFSIGIEMDNPGFVTRVGDKWRALHLGTEYRDDEVMPDEHLASRGWVKYTDTQIQEFERIAKELKQVYPTLRELVGHSDVCVPAGRKLDPGPAWPKERFSQLLA